MSINPRTSAHYRQLIASERIHLEWRRQLEARGYIFGIGVAWDSVIPPPGADPEESAALLRQITEEYDE